MSRPGGSARDVIRRSAVNAGDANGHVYLLAHHLAGTLTDPSGAVIRSVAFSPDNRYVAIGDASGKVLPA